MEITHIVSYSILIDTARFNVPPNTL